MMAGHDDDVGGPRLLFPPISIQFPIPREELPVAECIWNRPTVGGFR